MNIQITLTAEEASYLKARLQNHESDEPEDPQHERCRASVWEKLPAICPVGNNVFRTIDAVTDYLIGLKDVDLEVGDTTSGRVIITMICADGVRRSLTIDPDHATRIAERLWDCAATGRAVQAEIENTPIS